MPKRSRQDELFARIAQSPDDDSNYLVYADALASACDPQGELIALMYQLATAEHDGDETRRAQLGAWLDAYLVEHRARLFGELAKHTGIAWDFHLGFLRSVAVVPDIRDDAAALITQILELPIARLVRELVVFEGIERRRPPIADAVAAAKPTTLAGVVFATKHTSIADIADRETVRWFELPYAAGATGFPAELLELPNLELLEVSRTQVAAIPPAIGALRRLRRLDISWCNELEDLPEELFGIETLSYIQMYDCFGLRTAFHMGRVNHLLAGFVRARTPSRRRIVETNLFLGRDRRALELASDTDLLAALDNNVAAVRDSALRCLAARVPDRLGEPLAKGSSFALIGKTNFDKARIAAAVTERGAALTTKITGATTHVIVGSQPAGKQVAIGDRVIVLEAHLKAWLAPTAKRGTASLDDTRTALRSRDEARTLNAIAGLGGELPAELCADVVVVAIDVKLKKSREAAKKLLATAAPASVLAAIKTHLKQSLLLESMGETKRTDRIIAFCHAAKVIDPLALAEVLVARARVGLGYLFAHGTPAGITRALEARVANGVLDLHLAEIAAVPSQVGSLATVVELDLSQNHLTRWPEPVLAMPALERLDLSSNRIARVPETAGALQITALDLGRNRMRQFPLAVLNIATLVELDVSNSQEYVDDEARITGLPEQIGALPRLERFSYRFQIIEAFPDALFALPKLAELDLMMCTLPETIPPRLAQLSTLTQLDLRYSTWAPRAPAIRPLLPGCKVLAAS